MPTLKVRQKGLIAHHNHLQTIVNCDALYQTVIDDTGRFLTPLVGLAGRYHDPVADKDKQWVSTIFVDFAEVEKYPFVLKWFVDCLVEQARDKLRRAEMILGLPTGGLAFGYALASRLDCRFRFPEKRTVELPTANSREISVLDFVRHHPERGLRIWLAEDVCTNFSTTEQAVNLVEKAGSEVAGIVCLLNRSGKQEWHGRPVISLVELKMPQYHQDDDFVQDAVRADQVVWKPKEHWEELVTLMRRMGPGSNGKRETPVV